MIIVRCLSFFFYGGYLTYVFLIMMVGGAMLKLVRW